MPTFMATVLLSRWANAFFFSLREVGLLISAFGSSRSASSAYQKWPTRHTCICDALSPRQAHLSPIQSLRRGKGRSGPTTSNHSLYLMKLPAGWRPSRLSLADSSPRRESIRREAGSAASRPCSCLLSWGKLQGEPATRWFD